MYEFKSRRNIRSSSRYSPKGSSTKSTSKVSMEYIVIIAFIVILFIRAVVIINENNERGAYAYVQLLNFGMPIVENQAYNEEDFQENRLSVKTVVSEALGLGDINAFTIMGKELSLFNVGSNEVMSGNGISSSKPIAGLKPFSLKDNSVAKLTPEQIAELNKVSSAYDPSLKKPLDNSKPEVLIYHTHATENYAEADKDTTDNNFNVVGVGEILAKELEEGYGISVIHDKTVHSLGGYNDSYLRSEETVQSYLNTYGDFKLIIDLHRDSAPRNSVVTEVNGETIARMMFVQDSLSGRYDAQKAMTDKLTSISESLFPGLLKTPTIYDGGKNHFNQDLSDNSLLIECGSNSNSAQEAKLTAKYIARLLAEYLNR